MEKIILKNDLDQEIYLLKLKNKRNKVIKIIKNFEKKERKRKEEKIYKYLRKIFPDKFSYNKIKKILRNNYCDIYSEIFIEGETLYDFLDKYDLQEEASKELVDILYALYKVPITKQIYQYLKISRKFDWADYLNNNFDRFINTIEREQSLTKQTIYCLKKFWKKNKYLLKDVKKLTLLHNDLNQNNILLKIEKYNVVKCKIFDFEWCIIGDPIKDLSKLVWTFRKYPIFKGTFFSFYKKKFFFLEKIEEKLEIYWIYDMVRHIHQKKKLLKIKVWEQYLAEEKNILENYFKKEDDKWNI
jgi:hypothetical protein